MCQTDGLPEAEQYDLENNIIVPPEQSTLNQNLPMIENVFNAENMNWKPNSKKKVYNVPMGKS